MFNSSSMLCTICRSKYNDDQSKLTRNVDWLFANHFCVSTWTTTLFLSECVIIFLLHETVLKELSQRKIQSQVNPLNKTPQSTLKNIFLNWNCLVFLKCQINCRHFLQNLPPQVVFRNGKFQQIVFLPFHEK